MKLSFILLSFAISTAAFAQTDPSKCFSITNNLDRKYCLDKYLESVKDKLAAEKKGWNGALDPAAKSSKLKELDTSVQTKKDQINLMNAEIALYETHAKDVAALQDAAPKKEKKKKKKNKLPFGIKL